MNSHGARLALLATVTAAVLAAAASSAEARFASQAHFALRSNGYHVEFSGQGPGSAVLYPDRVPASAPKVRSSPSNGSIDVAVRRHGALSDYMPFSGASFGRKHLVGRIGRFGAVDVSFHRRSTHRLKLRRCHGYIERRFGTFTGTIRFRGEHGYVDIGATRARGRVTIPRHLRCRAGSRPGSGPHGVELDAETPRGTTSFSALRSRRFHSVFYFANAAETTPHVFIFRTVSRRAPRDTFSFSPDLGSAELRPPPPFSGSGEFTAPGAWSGDLAASFPGERDISLAGRRFTARLKRF